MKISIIIPVFGVQDYILDCLRSVAYQTCSEDIECIIVDDCTLDNSIVIANQFCSQYSGRIDFKIIKRDKNGGLSAARNTGLSVATGEYIYFLDSDDEITVNCIQNLVEPLATKRYDFVVGGLTIINSAQRDVPNVPLLLDRGEFVDTAIIQTYSMGLYYMMAWNKLCRREFLIKNNLYFSEGIIHEDNIWSFQMACRAESMYVVPDACYIYKIRSNSITTNQKYEKRTMSLLVIAELMEQELRKCGNVKVKYASNIVQQWLYVVINHCSYKMDNIGVMNVYVKMRKLFKQYKRVTASTMKIRIIYAVRDFHYFLPSGLGFMWILIMRKIF